MKFDIIIGNPPYNDSSESGQKKNGATTQGATFYQKFINKSKQLIKDDGTIAFILPGGAYNSFLDEGLVLTHVHHIDGRFWPKVLSTKAWFAIKPQTGMFYSKPTQSPDIFNKILDTKHYQAKAGKGGGAITTYSFTKSCFTEAEDKVYKTSYVKSKDKKFQRNNPTQWDLPDTDINVTNLTFLLKWFADWFHFYGYQWYMWNKLFDYKWIDGKTQPITEQDIIDYYGFDENDLKVIKKLEFKR